MKTDSACFEPTPAPARRAARRVLCERWLAGESVEELAKDYDLLQREVLQVLRAGLTHKRLR